MEQKIIKNNNSVVLCISDMHHPYGHPDTYRFLKAIKKKYQPTRVVCMGDEIDHHAMSFHDSDVDLRSAGDELQAAVKELKKLYKLFPECHVIDSNHGSMAMRKAKHHGIPMKYLRPISEVLQAPSGWTWTHDLTLKLPGGQVCYFHHGITADIMKTVMLRGTCMVQGHYHSTFKIGYVGNPNSLLWGLQVGCLIDKHSMAFAYDRTNMKRPILGTGIIINGQPKLLPMVLNSAGRWNGKMV